MNRFRARKSWIVFIAVLLLFAACKGESPTAPPPGGTPPGGTPPPAGVNVTLAASNLTPLIDSTVTITATVTNNGQPVPNGTAVEFSSSAGSLDGGGQATIKTTNNGVATVTLTSGATGPVRVFATVNNITRQIDVNFQSRPITPPPPNTAPTIVSVAPSVGRPQGGEVIRITGTNFKAPVRVLFNTGGTTPLEGSVQSVSDTVIEVVTPPVNLGAGQQLVADIIVFTQAGTASEQRVEASDAFTYRNERLTPNIRTVTPNSGPVTGGTRVTIFGEAFQEPVQVLFNTAEARVLNVTYDRINIETPAGRDTNPDGSGTVTGPVSITVRNINSDTSDTMSEAFFYKAAMQITAVSPTEGPFTGGTRVDIEGIGFVAPVAVTIGGVAAQPIFVSGTKVTAITSALALASCADSTGAISVTNVANGDTATATQSFIYRVIEPVIVNVAGALAPGSTIDVLVANALGTPRLTLGDTTLIITGTSVNPTTGITTYTATIPTTIDLDEEECPAVPGASRQVATAFSITYTSLTTGCSDTLNNAAILNPLPNQPRLTLAPAAFSQFNATITPDDPDTPANELSVAPSAPQTVTVTNTGTGSFTVISVTPNGACGNFAIATPTLPATLNSCDPFPITAIYQGRTTAPFVEQCVLQVNTSIGTRNLTLTGTSSQ